MRTWAFFDPATGLFSGRCITTASELALAANTPPGLRAIEGRYDHLSQRVDLETGKVVDWQPQQPSADHEWNSDTRRWQLQAAVAKREHRRAEALAKIQALEASQARAVRELAIDPNNNTARTRLRAVDAQIAELRKDLSA